MLIYFGTIKSKKKSTFHFKNLVVTGSNYTSIQISDNAIRKPHIVELVDLYEHSKKKKKIATWHSFEGVILRYIMIG